MRNWRAHIILFDLLNRLIWMFKFRSHATQFARGLRVWLIPFLPSSPPMTCRQLFRFFPLPYIISHRSYAVGQRLPKLDSWHFPCTRATDRQKCLRGRFSFSPYSLSECCHLIENIACYRLCLIFTDDEFLVIRRCRRRNDTSRYQFKSRSSLNI